MKLAELKAKVYELSGVTTTKQLKAKYKELKTLDLRCRDAWTKALTFLQSQQQIQQDEFNQWLENPPEEYQKLFVEIEDISKRYDQKREEVKQLGEEIVASADDLEKLAKECQEEAIALKREVKAARRIRKQAQLN